MGGTSLRGVVFSIGLIAILIAGCGESDSSKPGGNHVVTEALSSNSSSGNGKKQGQAFCPEGRRICDMDGNVRVCAGNSAGHRKNPTNSVGPVLTCADGETCYFGECSTGPEVPLPPVGDAGGIADDAIAEIPLTADALVIPYEAFVAAIAGRDFTTASQQRIDQATVIAANANDLTVGGLAASFQETTAFSGDVFIVVHDAERNEPAALAQFGLAGGGALAAAGATAASMFAKSYFVVVGELSGQTSWVGTDARWLQTASSNQGVRNTLPAYCCPVTLGCFVTPTPTPGCGGPAQDCQPFSVEGLAIDPTVSKFALGNGGRFEEGQPPRRADGKVAVSIHSLPDRGELGLGFAAGDSKKFVDSFPPVPGNPDPPAAPPQVVCQACNEFLCPDPGLDPDGSGTPGPPPAQCGGAPQDVSLLCQSSDTDGCFGVCGDCSGESGGSCEVGPLGTRGVLGGDSSLAAAVCRDASDVPDYCKEAQGSPC